EELQVGAGKVDIVVGVAHEDRFNRRREALNRPASNPDLEAVLLANIYRNRPLRLPTIARRSGVETDDIIGTLEALLECNLCFRPSKSTFQRTPIAEPFRRIVAIEGKLERWEKALAQAYRNRLFATESYVVLDAKHALPAIKHIKQFVH